MTQTKNDTRITVTPGCMYFYTMPYSKACVHLNVAGKRMGVKVNKHEQGEQTSYEAQLYKTTTRAMEPYSFPILLGEAGIYHDSKTNELYTYLDEA